MALAQAPTAPTALTEATLRRQLLPELRREIAEHCDRQSLVQLSRVGRFWYEEAEPVLFRNVRLFLRYQRHVLAFIEAVTRCPQKALWVRALLIEKKIGFRNRASPELIQAVQQLLPLLPNLVDLRLRGHDIEFQIAMIEPLLPSSSKIRFRTVAPECTFRLRTLYVAEELLHGVPFLLEDVIRWHGPTLRVVAVEETDADCLYIGTQDLARCFWNDELRTRCALLTYHHDTDSQRITLCMAAPTASKIAAAARSFPADPSVDAASAAVDSLYLDYPTDIRAGAPDPMSRVWASHFPHTVQVHVVIPSSPLVEITGEGVSAAVRPFGLLDTLHIVGPMQSHNIPTSAPIAWNVRHEWAARVVSDGSTQLRVVLFPDNSYLLRDEDEAGVFSDWYEWGQD